MMDKKLPYIIASGILIVFVGAAIFLVHLPLSGVIQAKQLDLKQKNDQLNTVREKVKELAKLRNDIEKMKIETEILQSQIPNATDIPSVIKLVEKFADENDVIVGRVIFPGSVQPGTNTGAANTSGPVIMTNLCQISLKGRYGSLVQFFEALKSSPRLFGIKSINFSPTGDDGRELNINLELAFFNYSAPPTP